MIEVQITSRIWDGITWNTYQTMKAEYSKWCLENVTVNGWDVTYNQLYIFEHEIDAVAFKLRFGL